LFIKGQVVRVVPEAEMVDALLDEARKLAEEGVEARLAAADGVADEIARETAAELLAAQGDINQSEERRARVAEVAGEKASSE
jgi:(E)-4-hydroxy-3-methylbut-2-enyl-diphosphate synthase